MFGNPTYDPTYWGHRYHRDARRLRVIASTTQAAFYRPPSPLTRMMTKRENVQSAGAFPVGFIATTTTTTTGYLKIPPPAIPLRRETFPDFLAGRLDWASWKSSVAGKATDWPWGEACVMTEASCPRTHVGHLKLHLPLNLNCGTCECKLEPRGWAPVLATKSVVESASSGSLRSREENRFHDT